MPSYTSIFFLLIAASVFLEYVAAAPASDLVTSLPGQPQVPFKQYSGYIAIGKNSSKALFYYFVEAVSDHETRPLTLWLNGGPGCSSVGLGAFTELGPFYPDPKSNGQRLIRNGYAWNQVSNMLFIDSPVRVGWSYSDTKELYNDDKTSKDLAIVLHGWFAKFPEYRDTVLYISGESYAGHYVPQLATRLLDGKMSFNLKGIAIGNPLLDVVIDYISNFDFLWSHTAISDKTYQLFQESCTWTNYGDYANTTQSCFDAIQKAYNESGDIDAYDLLDDNCLPGAVHQENRLKMQKQRIPSLGLDACISQRQNKYFNTRSVQEALHANTTGLAYSWNECAMDELSYNDTDNSIQIRPALEHLLKQGLRVLIYSGDADSVVPFIGTRLIVGSIVENLKLKTTVPYSSWYSHKQIGGWWQENGNLSYATVRGAGHMVPYTQPRRALTLFRAFVEGKQLPKK